MSNHEYVVERKLDAIAELLREIRDLLKARSEEVRDETMRRYGIIDDGDLVA